MVLCICLAACLGFTEGRGAICGRFWSRCHRCCVYFLYRFHCHSCGMEWCSQYGCCCHFCGMEWCSQYGCCCHSCGMKWCSQYGFHVRYVCLSGAMSAAGASCLGCCSRCRWDVCRCFCCLSLASSGCRSHPCCAHPECGWTGWSCCSYCSGCPSRGLSRSLRSHS